MDLALVALAIAALGFVVAILMGLIEWKSLQITLGIQKWLGHESEVAAMERENQPSIIEEFDAYMSEYDEETKMTRLEAIGSVIGARMYQALRFSNMQSLSVDSKVQKKYDGMVETAIRKKQPLEWKIAQKALDYFGIDIDLLEIAKDGELGNLKRSFDKYGINPSTSQGNVM